MSQIVSTFVNVHQGKSKYLFFLVRANDYESKIKKGIEENWKLFGAALGVDGTAIEPYATKTNSTFGEVEKKNWPPDVLKRIWASADGFMLIIDKDFANFDPAIDRWGIIWLSDFEKEAETIYKLFDTLAKKAVAGEDIFDWVSSQSKKIKFEKAEGFFEAKPGIFGFAINLKEILKWLVGKKL